jgi:hypothetical protein
MHEELRRALELLKKGRQYASFFEWTDKEGKELGVAQEFVKALNAEMGLALSSPRLQRPDPPDAICTSAAGERVAVEIAELVTEEAVRRTAMGEDLLRVWRPGDVSSAVSGLLLRKDEKTFHGGPFGQLYVCLFTDEPMLTIDAAREELAAVKFGPFRQITDAFLLFSYDPGTRTYPVIRLALHA